MFPCCWIITLLVFFASLGVSFFKQSKEFIIFEIVLVMAIVVFFILRKVKNKKNKCCSKINNPD